MSRITSDTPDPAWLVQVDQDYAAHLESLRALPIIRDGREGVLREGSTVNFLLQIGRGIIEPFPFWLGNMLRRADCHQAQLFLRSNRLEERHHWQWWQDMASHYGILASQFKDIALGSDVEKLNRYLNEASTDFSLACALSAINFSIETGAAILTAEIAPGMSGVLNTKELRWIEEHAAGDPDHSADSRELIKLLVRDETAVQDEVRATVNRAGYLFTSALLSAY